MLNSANLAYGASAVRLCHPQTSNYCHSLQTPNFFFHIASVRLVKAMAGAEQTTRSYSSGPGEKQALISLSDKKDLAFLGNGLQGLGFTIVSTGGTASALEEAGVPVTKVEQLTGFPEMLDGRVKTLHPKVHGGILARRDLKHHMEALKEHEIGTFDVVVVNLYPFYDKVSSASGISFEDGIENIDIGGPAMIRAAAKNHRDVLVVVDPKDYSELLEYLKGNQGDEWFHRKLAWKAFEHVSSYDSAVSEWLWKQTGVDEFPPKFTVPLSLKSSLRYGENPHQKAAFYVDKRLSEVQAGGIATAIQHHGKEMSYNNYLDADAAWNCVSEFEKPTCVIVKHTNPCGVASRENILEAYRLAVKADPVSAFGGIVAFNVEVDEALAKDIREFRSPADGETRMFYEIVVAPKYSEKGLEILRGKSKTLRILEANKNKQGKLSLRQVGGGWLVQDSDDLIPQDIQFKVVSERTPLENELHDAEFAWLCVKHVKSNAIVIAKDDCMLGMGSGQPNRVESLRIALRKAGDEVKGAALASDAFFPFAWNDAVEEACKSGIGAIAEPGGSIRDNDAIDCCNKYEDGVSLLRKVCLASDFVRSRSPDDIGSFTSISFDDPSCLLIKEHSLTTEEIKILCDDLEVLGQKDRKCLLKWRNEVRKALYPTQSTVKVDDVPDDNKGEDDKIDNENKDEDDEILNEMEELTYAIDRKKKCEKKMLARRLAKEKCRGATGMQIDALMDGYTDLELFSLSSIKRKRDLNAVNSSEFIDEKGAVGDSDNEVAGENPKDSFSDADSEEEHRQYDMQLEELLDSQYQRFVTRTYGTAHLRKRAKMAYAENSMKLLEGGEAEGIVDSVHDSDIEEVDSEVNPLMVSFHDQEQPNKEEMMEKWFSQDMFANLQEQLLVKNDSGDEMEDIQEEKHSHPKEIKESMIQLHANYYCLSQSQAPREEGDFEVVPSPATDSTEDSSSEGSIEEDEDGKAEMLACAKKILQKKQRKQIEDDAYNKYMFDDKELPTFFLDYEKRHRQPIKPVTKEEITAMKAQFKEIDARPAKKVVQAKARKKRAAMRKLDKVRKKANTISDQTDINERSKMKLINQLYKKAMPKKPRKEYVVAKKGVRVKSLGQGKVLVDRRLKKDMRCHGMGSHGKESMKKGKGKGNDAASRNKGRKASKGKMAGDDC